jgi:hypothetical protein
MAQTGCSGLVVANARGKRGSLEGTRFCACVRTPCRFWSAGGNSSFVGTNAHTHIRLVPSLSNIELRSCWACTAQEYTYPIPAKKSSASHASHPTVHIFLLPDELDSSDSNTDFLELISIWQTGGKNLGSILPDATIGKKPKGFPSCLYN